MVDHNTKAALFRGIQLNLELLSRVIVDQCGLFYESSLYSFKRVEQLSSGINFYSSSEVFISMASLGGLIEPGSLLYLQWFGKLGIICDVFIQIASKANIVLKILQGVLEVNILDYLKLLYYSSKAQRINALAKKGNSQISNKYFLRFQYNIKIFQVSKDGMEVFNILLHSVAEDNKVVHIDACIGMVFIKNLISVVLNIRR